MQVDLTNVWVVSGTALSWEGQRCRVELTFSSCPGIDELRLHKEAGDYQMDTFKIKDCVKRTTVICTDEETFDLV